MPHPAPPGWASNMPYEAPRCECHDCTQARAAERAMTMQGQVYTVAPVQYAWCPNCGNQYVIGNHHECLTGGFWVP